jgi:hypothetical protein
MAQGTVLEPRPPTSRRRRRRTRRARFAVLARRSVRPLIAIGALLLVVAAWIAVRGLQARQHLLDAQRQLDAVHSQLLEGTDSTAALAALQRDTRAAKDETSDPVWTALSWFPPVHTVRGIAAQVDRLSQDVLPPLTQAGRLLAPQHLRVKGDTIALAPIAQARVPLHQAGALMAGVVPAVDRLPGGWFAPLTKVRNDLAAQVHNLAGSIDNATRFADVAPAMLGADGPRRYFIGIQNNAEARGTGGLLGGYLILVADHGRLHVETHGDDRALRSTFRPVVDLGADFRSVYGGYNAAGYWRSSNLGPDFRDAAAIWAGLWQAQSHERVDGAIGTDPFLLASLLHVTGPVAVPGTNVTLTAENAVKFLESQQYALFSPQANDARKDFLGVAAEAVVRKLLSGAGDAHALVTAMAQSAGAGRLTLWSARPAEEATLLPTPIAGAVPNTTGPFAALTVDNAAGTKLDYYLDRSLTYQAGACDGPRRLSTITVRLTNGAPPTGLPPYVLLRFDLDRTNPTPERLAQNRLLVFVQATHGAQLVRAMLDGQPHDVSVIPTSGHTVLETEVTIDPGRTTELTLYLDEPTVGGAASTVVQPLVHPQQTSLDVPVCPVDVP